METQKLSEVFHKPLPSGKYKIKMKDESIPPSEDFNGKAILVIGCEPRKQRYKEEIEKRNGVFLWAVGTEGQSRLKSLIQKADFVALLTSFIRHQAGYDTVDYCKKYNVPFSAIQGLGIQSLIDEVNNKTLHTVG